MLPFDHTVSQFLYSVGGAVQTIIKYFLMFHAVVPSNTTYLPTVCNTTCDSHLSYDRATSSSPWLPLLLSSFY